MFSIITKECKPTTLIISILVAIMFSSNAWSAVRPKLTRVVAYAENKETSVDIINESTENYLIQSWLEDTKGNEDSLPLVLTPPMMKIGARQEGKLRLVVLPIDLPQDRESVYWLSIQEIPPKAKNNAANKLVIAIRSRLKVFVRPQGLNGADAAKAIKMLKWTVERNGKNVWLKVRNPTPYHVSFGKLELKNSGQKSITLNDKTEMAAPMSTQKYLVPVSLQGKSATLTYSAVNDYGGETEVLTTEVNL
ncbi:fimbrial biogenesis chaperone [Pluralibacter gergoviae]|uniref:fimbrial biogenesis chaperone n=1 Tax=Pluralibacter gergoviae TaxID=61647 RepID=UPI00155F46CF|nr:molecular chaperone [Pluralibacter gergoviae]